MKPWKWVKEHPVEAMAIAAGLAIGGPMVVGALGGTAAAGAAGATAAGASGAVAADAAAIAAAEAAAASAGSPALLGAGAGGASLGAEAAAAGAGLGAESALLAGLPMTEYGLGGAGEAMAGGGASSLLGPYAAPAADPALLGGNTALSSPYSGWWDKATATLGDKLKDPKTVMRLGQMTMQMGTPRQQGGPQGGFEQPSYRSAMHSQEDITKKWLLQNDPNTYRRIYGNPPGVA